MASSSGPKPKTASPTGAANVRPQATLMSQIGANLNR